MVCHLNNPRIMATPVPAGVEAAAVAAPAVAHPASLVSAAAATGVGGVAPAIRKTPRQLAFDIARRRYFEARDIAEPESDDEFDFESLAAAALSVPAATKEGRFLGDELPRIFDRKGSSFLFRKYPKSTVEDE